MEDADFQEFLGQIRELTPEQVHEIFSDRATLMSIRESMTPEQYQTLLITKNTVMFGGINEYIADFVAQTGAKIPAMPEGPGKEAAKQGQRLMVERLMKEDGVSDANKAALQGLLGNVLAAAAAGGKRKMSRKYCKKTPCRKMGFSQRASCHPYKKCSTRRARRGRVST